MGALHHHRRLFPLLFTAAVATFLAATTTTTAHNITDILAPYPEYSLFSSFLSQTKLDDDVNTRSTVTVLALTNGPMSALTAKHPLSVIKKVLCLNIVLDYYDGPKLHRISDGTTLTTTLCQTTGNVEGNLGSVNITDLQGGRVGFGSAAPGSKLDSTYTKSIKQIPYNLSVLEISAPIIAPGVLTAPAPSASDVNITGLLEKAGCKTFAALILSSGVIKIYQSAIAKGLTIFAPNDEAFKADNVPDLTKLTNAEVVTLLQYHALADYTPIGTLKTTKNPISTLATNGASKYDLTVSSAGDSVTLQTGVDTSRVAETVLDSTPLCIFTVDSVLLPVELFGSSPTPAPAPGPALAPAPSSPTPAPSTAPESAASPTPVASPPAPPTETPEGAPAGGPDTEPENSTSDNGAVDLKSPAMFKVITTVSATVIATVLLS